MKRLAWWAIGIGVVVEAASSVGYTLAMEGKEPLSYSYKSGWYFVGALCGGTGDTILLIGGFLLAATVIADAITKAQGTREGP